MMIGSVYWYDKTRGYGWIRVEGTDCNLYVGRRALAESGIVALECGQRVEFEVRNALKGPEAVHLRSPVVCDAQATPAPRRGPIQPDDVPYFLDASYHDV